MSDWMDVCAMDDIEEEDVLRFDQGERTFALYRSLEGEVYCTDGLCTHEKVHLADGLVLDELIECPKHNARFNFKTGEAVRRPACVALATYPARVNGERIEVQV